MWRGLARLTDIELGLEAGRSIGHRNSSRGVCGPSDTQGAPIVGASDACALARVQKRTLALWIPWSTSEKAMRILLRHIGGPDPAEVCTESLNK